MSENTEQPKEVTPTTFGRPPTYTDPIEMQKKIDEYFRGGMTKKTMYTKDGDPYEVPIPTITGLVLYLGFDGRQSFYDYEKKPEFSYTIKKARSFIEKEYEQILITTGSSGAIFALKNFGWHDKTEVEMSGAIKETRAKIKDFLDGRHNARNDDGSAEPTAETNAGPDDGVATTPTDIS